MPDDQCLGVRRRLRMIIRDCGLIHEPRISRYDPGQPHQIDVTGVCPALPGRASLEIEQFVGGGFAGQVYKVKLHQIDCPQGAIHGLEPGRSYAVKIIRPPSRFSLAFRNALYWIAYQGDFSAQVNRAAARSGALWQKLIRRGGRIAFGAESSMVDIYATFFDSELGSFAEINEWVEGRTWRYEIDDRLFGRSRRSKAPGEGSAGESGSPEYMAKRHFMADLVRHMHEMGAPELARQYEWWTLKSQPNALKRMDAGPGPDEGLTAIDFRAGLALLPFLPMSPADFRLIVRGLRRGHLVQFDRGDLGKLDGFIKSHEGEFKDLAPALEELHNVEADYRASLPDITHHGARVFTDRSLRRSVRAGYVDGWRRRGLTDERGSERLRASTLAFILFLLAGIIPFLGRLGRRLWGDARFASHVGRMLASPRYFLQTLKAGRAESLTEWHRKGRTGDERTLRLADRPVRFFLQSVLLAWWLPAKWHRFLAEPGYAWDRIKEAVSTTIRLALDPSYREEWLMDQVHQGRAEGMLTPVEEARIIEHIKDPFIQKYLKCVAVHFCTLPVTQVVAVIVAAYVVIRYGETWQQGMLYATGVLAFFQATPISPGSIVRGTFVLYLMIRERNVRNYWLAALISFWHYIGYLAFPIQMVSHYPALARFMGGRWATRVVHFVPVFGERGALLEHWAFDLFFNLPITLRRILSGRKAGKHL